MILSPTPESMLELYVGACVGTLADKWITWEWSGYH
jgi:hypothetical protein